MTIFPTSRIIECKNERGKQAFFKESGTEREFLLRICPIAVWFVAAIELAIMLLALKGSDKGKKRLHLLTALVCFGLFCDALIIALGPATGNFDLIFFISMFGEVCMALFFLVYEKQREH